ncbi:MULTISPECIES: hypothetical protein [unclassified Halorhabdus]|uniref:hypothetical protein n=1 Tax=unclassified Halorhabdus TaxID=2621901 RepID=UPI0023DB6AEE|nr:MULTISPECIES: hypothetical protein [unclassified Halorhabdus]WEL18090.1 putative membrane protein [Halorhabdus sp. SVX81]WEL21971.1 putative membrane protein [Halorhabdus sp. BNX81]
MSRNDSVDETERSLLSDDRVAGVRGFPWLEGIVTGGVAWIVGYALTTALFYVGPASLTVESHVQKLKGIGVIFYNAHFVDALETLSNGEMQETVRFNMILEQSGSTIPDVVYFSIPVLVLAVAGLLVGQSLLDSETEHVTFGLVGVALAGGYVLLAIPGIFLAELAVRWRLGIVVLTPAPLETVAFSFAYAFVLGAIGAFLGTRLDR